DPPDGRIPLTPEARKRRAALVAAEAVPTGPEDLPLRLRCVTRGLPMTPTPNNNYFQIVQGQGFVVILQEMMYEARVIPLDGRPHAPASVRPRSEEHTSELQSRENLVCRLLLEKK